MNKIKSLLNKYFSSFVYFYRYLGYRIFIVILLGLVIGSLDALGLTMFLPLIELADGNGQAQGENMGGLGFIVVFLNDFGIDLTLGVALFILSFFFILKGLATYFSEGYKVSAVQ